MNAPTTQRELIDRIEREYIELEQLLVRIPAARATEPGVTDEWSARDVVAHMIYWQDFVCDRIDAVIEGRAPEPDTAPEDTDRINRQAVLERRTQTWQEVHTEFERSTQRVIQTVASLSDEDLFVPGRYRPVYDGPLWMAIDRETYSHYEGHAKQLRSWLERIGG